MTSLAQSLEQLSRKEQVASSILAGGSIEISASLGAITDSLPLLRIGASCDIKHSFKHFASNENEKHTVCRFFYSAFGPWM